jgi:hypothetical protein
MRRGPPRQSESTDSDSRSASDAQPPSRLRRLQVILLVVLGLWFIDSGMGALTDGATSLEAGSVPAVEEPTAAEPKTDVDAVRELLATVNPNLDPSELSRITAAVFRYSDKYGLDPELVTAVLLVESSARPWVRSQKGAVGLMQVMPHMMEPLGLTGNAATIESNIEAGCWILAGNIRRLGEEKGISSYFWGSDIRGLAYLEKVRSARAEVRRRRPS